MNIKKFAHGAKVYEDIKSLDAQILEIEKFAMLAANGNIKGSIKLSVEDLDKKDKEGNKVKFDEDGSLMGTIGMYRSALSFPFSFGCSTPEKEPENFSHYKADITENNLLQVLGILLYEKNFLRNQLIQKLNKIGIEV